MPKRDTSQNRISRRSVLRGSAGLAGLSTATALGLPHIARAQGGFDWKKYKGEKLEVSITKSPRGDLLQKYRKEFEDLTGITVGDEQVPEQQHRQKVIIEFASGNPSFDVITVAYHVQKRLYGKGKWLEDLRPFIKDASMTSPDFDFADFAKGAIDYGTHPDGRLDSLPLNLDYFILFWNKELFQAKGVAYPKNYDEILQAAEKLHDPKNGIAGFVCRGLKNANLPPWSSFMLGYDKDFIDPKTLKMNTDGPEAIESAKIYQKLTQNFSPAGVAGFNWSECQGTFALGKAAMWLDGIGFALPLEDKTKSRIVGKVGYGVMPRGPKAQHSSLFGDGIGIPANCKKKGAAWLYCQWATNKVMTARSLEGAYGAPGRSSAYEAVKDSKELKAPREWLDCMRETIKIARPGLPEILAVTEFRDVFGIALTNMIGGADPASELKKATEQFKPVLEKTENA
jgi:multiple sugar transport system substrate-binding protein